jgi:ribosomal protein L37E
MQQAIRIETLGDLVAHDYGLNVTCERCRHRSDLDMAALIQRFGADFRYVGPTLDRHLVCGRCGEKTVAVQIHNLQSNRSRFA